MVGSIRPPYRSPLYAWVAGPLKPGRDETRWGPLRIARPRNLFVARRSGLKVAFHSLTGTCDCPSNCQVSNQASGYGVDLDGGLPPAQHLGSGGSSTYRSDPVGGGAPRLGRGTVGQARESPA